MARKRKTAKRRFRNPPAGRGSPPRRPRAGWASRVVCLTEESVEFLYDLDLGDLVVGVSRYVRRPEEATGKPKVSSFIDADFEKIVELEPDLVITFSDIQASITHDLMKRGVPVFATNQRSLDEILMTMRQIGALVGYPDEADLKCNEYEKALRKFRDRARRLPRRPRVYFEEWNDPMITSIRWVSELIEICGGDNIFAHLADNPMASQRFVSPRQVVDADPELVLASWCGKPFKKDKFVGRKDFDGITAVRSDEVHSLPSEIILQPGPALFGDGLQMVFDHIARVARA